MWFEEFVFCSRELKETGATWHAITLLDLESIQNRTPRCPGANEYRLRASTAKRVHET
jgi:hypothetical protein